MKFDCALSLRPLLAGAVLAQSGTCIALPISSDCETTSLAAALPSGATVTWAYRVATNGTLSTDLTGQIMGGSLIFNGPACVLQANIPTDGNTSYNFGLVLPDTWNKRFLATGNSGYGGSVSWRSLADGMSYGFAVVSTDTGHTSSPLDASWALNEPEMVKNWGYRALHGSIVNAKAIIEDYYGTAPLYSYYRGCSAGGKQGMKEVEMYPDDFDGIIAGAPAWWTNHVQIWNGIVGYWNTPTTADYYVPTSLFSVLGAEMLKQCDPQDGVTDNIISDPIGCNFHPETLLCKTGQTESCFTAAQLTTVYKWYHDWVENGQYVFSHFQPGSEWQWASLVGLLADGPSDLGTGWMQYMLGLGANWTWDEWNPSIIKLSEKLNPGNATADNFDLSPFNKKGGKLLHYHGLGDGSVAPGSSIYFYDHVSSTLSPKGINLDDFYRFFLIPGMGHCTSTDPNSEAPWYIAGDGQAAELSDTAYSVPGFSDAEHDILLAVMAWVEKGKAPESIVATVYGDTTNTVLRQRPLCKYPEQAVYAGHGSVNVTTNWTCKK